ncbi:MAG: hypothetical protein ACXABY_10520 [Candidatus Thorarchaeota archaeon]
MKIILSPQEAANYLGAGFRACNPDITPLIISFCLTFNTKQGTGLVTSVEISTEEEETSDPQTETP